MEVLDLAVDTHKSLTLPWLETTIMPISDAHIENASDEDRLRRHFQWGIKQGAYFLGVADYVDVASPSNRQKIVASDVHDGVVNMLEEAADDRIQRFLHLARGTEGRWLGILTGHHWYQFRDGSTSDTRIAKGLGATFLGHCAFIRARFNYQDKQVGHAITCTIWAHHGAGGGQKVASPLNKLENLMPYFDADIYVMGHQHKKVAATVNQLYMSRKAPYNIKHRKRILACTGGFLKGYDQGAQIGANPGGGYVERKLLNPVALGGIVLKVRPVYEKGDTRLDMNVEL